MKRVVLGLAIVYLLVLLGIWALVHFDRGTSWLVTLFLFGPRWVVALPLLILVPLTLALRVRLTWIYLLHCSVIIFPILGFQVSWPTPEPSQKGAGLRLMTCNLGGGKVRTNDIVGLVRGQQIQVLMLQECPWEVSTPVFQQLGWTHRQQGNMAIGSSLDLGEAQILARYPKSHYRTVAAVACELELPMDRCLDDALSDEPAGRAHLVCVHLPTFRPALQRAREFDFDTGSAIRIQADMYRNLAEDLRQRTQSLGDRTIIAGDFNVPVESTCYRHYWDCYRNAYSSLGTGFGYTKYTRFHGIRIDHVLVDDDWSIMSAKVGPELGGDHRPVIVELRHNAKS